MVFNMKNRCHLGARICVRRANMHRFLIPHLMRIHSNAFENLAAAAALTLYLRKYLAAVIVAGSRNR